MSDHLIVDVHHHWLPSPDEFASSEAEDLEFWRGVPANSLNGASSVFGRAEFHDLDLKLRAMDAVGVDCAVLSSNAGLHATGPACRWLNDGLAAFVERAPNRFVGLVHVNALDADAPEEIRHGVEDLGLRGVFLPTLIEGRPLDHPSLEPVWQAAEELVVPIVVHPSHVPPRYEMLDDHYDSPPFYHRMFGRELDVASTFVRLIFGGVLDRHPDLIFVLPHCGGGIAAMFERVEGFAQGGLILPDAAGFLRRAPREYLENIYVDAAGSMGGTAMIECAQTLFEPGHILFATDFPAAYHGSSAGPQMSSFLERATSVVGQSSSRSFQGASASHLFRVPSTLKEARA